MVTGAPQKERIARHRGYCKNPGQEPTLSRLLSIQDAAKELGVTTRTVYNRLDSGAIQGRKEGRRTVIERAELERYIAELPTYLDKPAA